MNFLKVIRALPALLWLFIRVHAGMSDDLTLKERLSALVQLWGVLLARMIWPALVVGIGAALCHAPLILSLQMGVGTLLILSEFYFLALWYCFSGGRGAVMMTIAGA